MFQTPLIKKIEIWTTDENDFEYGYAHTRRAGKKMDIGVVERAFKSLAKHSVGEVSERLRIDFIGGNPLLEFDGIKNIVENKGELEGISGKKLDFRVITNGLMPVKSREFLKERGVELRNSLESMEPTDAWWHSAGIVDSGSLSDEKISAVKETYGGFTHRLAVSQKNQEVKSRIERLLPHLSGDVEMVPVLSRECNEGEDIELQSSLGEFARWFRENLVERRVLPVLNAKRLLYMIHCRNENRPAPIKNHCNDTHERVMLDVDGVFRPCRHFHLYPNWTLGEADKGIYLKRSHNLHGFGLVMRNGCKHCAARFYCAGPCVSTAHYYGEKEFRPMGYHCLFTSLLTDAMEYVYNTLQMENPGALAFLSGERKA